MSKLEVFRKLIREEVKKAVREELKSFLTETSTRKVTKSKQPIIETKVSKEYKPITKLPQYSSNSPIQDLLLETAAGMNIDEYRTIVNADSSIAQGFPQMFMQEEESTMIQPGVVSNVSEMLANTRSTGDINQVQIDVVPDFTELMQTMKTKGQI